MLHGEYDTGVIMDFSKAFDMFYNWGNNIVIVSKFVSMRPHVFYNNCLVLVVDTNLSMAKIL